MKGIELNLACNSAWGNFKEGEKKSSDEDSKSNNEKVIDIEEIISSGSICSLKRQTKKEIKRGSLNLFSDIQTIDEVVQYCTQGIFVS